jgi:3-deoxy-7-phosphoheptulonate synthase
MRVYFEKPRTTVGWKGLINDPELDGSFQINKGLHLARQLLIDVNKMGLPAATEFLDTTFGQYYADLISLGTVGARTTESQVHRELASGLSMPVGFKNRTDGDVQVAIDAIVAAKQPHSFPSLTKEGSPAILETTGNSDCFLILRGGSVSGPNYDRAAILHAENLMSTVPINRSIVVDCSHGNSNKDYKRQVIVVDEVCNHLRSGDLPVKGVMIESHLKEGSQKVVPGKNLEYGLSITDKCISWEKTKGILDKLANANQFKKTGSVSNTL